MYQKVLTRQWNNLAEDFVNENQNAPVQTIAKFKEWYRVRIHRFSSISAIEGITLEQLNKPEFAEALKAEMSSFNFIKPEAQAVPDARIGVAVGAFACIAEVFLLPLLPFFWAKLWIIRLLLGILAFAVIFFWQISRATGAQNREKTRVLHEYERQLNEYLPGLLEVCKKYGVD